MDPLEFFATTVEELWYSPYPKRTQGRCSDVVAGPAATADGHLWVGHNNDLRPEAEADIVAIEKAVEDEPVVLQIGGVPWLSVGWNQAGLSLTGNELSPNDERVGISRSHQVFEMLRARNLHEMVAYAIRPDRASSYNNVLADRFGDVANVEGSATDVEITHLDERDHLAHTNHYVSERMQPYEGDPDYAVRSDVRFCRARDLLADRPPGSVTPEVLREHPLRSREPAERGVPASRVGASHLQDRLLVHRGRHGRTDRLRAREPVRLDGAGVRLRRLRRAA